MHPPFFLPAPPADRPSVLRVPHQLDSDLAPKPPSVTSPDPHGMRQRLGHWLIRMGEALTEPRPAR